MERYCVSKRLSIPSIDYSNQRAHWEESPLLRGEVQDYQNVPATSNCSSPSPLLASGAYFFRAMGQNRKDRQERLGRRRPRGLSRCRWLRHTTPPVVSTHSSAAGSINPGLLSRSPRCGVLRSAGIHFTPLAQPPHARLIHRMSFLCRTRRARQYR